MKHILNTLAFAAQHPGLHTYNRKRRATRRAVDSLAARGYLVLSQAGDSYFFQYTGKSGF